MTTTAAFLAIAVFFSDALIWAEGAWELDPVESEDRGEFVCGQTPLIIEIDRDAKRYHSRSGDFESAGAILNSGEKFIVLEYDGEERLTEAGDPVQWAMIFPDENSFYWYRLDWEEGSRTGMRRRCKSDEPVA